MKLVALSGYARCGKDTFADALVAKGWQRVAFADNLRNCLYALNPIVKELPVRIVEEKVELIGIRVKNVIDVYGWDGYKATEFGDEIRALMQRLGTEAGRDVLGDSIWVDSALGNLDPNGKYVVTDCRFPNEAEAIKQRGGKIVRITRPGVGPANAHPSETSLDHWDFDLVVENSGPLEDFKAEALRLFGEDSCIEE